MSTFESTQHTPTIRGVITQCASTVSCWLSTGLGADIECTVDEEWQADLHMCLPGITVVIHRPVWKTPGCVHVGPDSLLVIEPSVMVEVTEMAETVDDDRIISDVALIRRLTPRGFSSAAAMGSIVNAALDILLQDEPVNDEALLRMAERSRPLALAQLVRLRELEIARDRTRKLIPALRQGLADLAGQRISVEPTFISPDLGLIGRLDVLLEDPRDPHHKSIIELKSGNAPAGVGIRPSHRAQLVAYDLLLGSVDASRTGTSMIWYPAATAHPFRQAAVDQAWIRRIIQARNRIALLERGIADRRFDALQALRKGVLPPLPPFLADVARNISMDYAALDPQERLYMHAWMSFIAREQREQRTGNGNALWTSDLATKRSNPSAVTDLRLDLAGSDLERLHLRFERTRMTDDCSMRLGDLVVVYPVDDDGAARPWSMPLAKGTVRALTPHHVDVSLRNKHAQADRWPTDRSWIVEHDVTDSGLRDLYGNLGAWLAAPATRRSLLMGRTRPRTRPRTPIADDALMPGQRDVVERALAARDWFLIQGPPGTGKTSSVIRALAEQLLADPSERILLLAYTNRAADEICGVIERSLGADVYLRVGSKDGARSSTRSVHSLGASMEPEQLHHLLSSTRCYVATVAAMTRNADLIDHGRFTTTIVDEASQVLEPQLLGLLAMTDRFILVGDECQLPAVITQPADGLTVNHAMLSALELSDLGTSYFTRLMSLAVRHDWTDVIGRLTDQGRMHDAIGTVASALFYGGMLRPMHPWQSMQGAWLHTGDEQADHLLAIRLGAIDTHGGSDAVDREATIAADLAERFIHAADIAGQEVTVGIITPFRTQINAIHACMTETVRARVTVDTVERYQGSERDVIIFSAAVASQTDLDALSSEISTVFGIVDRKLNVLLTRARQQFVLIGDLSLLRRSRHYERLLDHATPMFPAHGRST